MNKLLLSFLFTCSFYQSFAQQNHFVYLQTYNNQPFYVRFENKVLSSSATGYLIIPKLNEGSYQFIIGFAKNEFPEQTFSISVKNNAGYELKNFGDKGWGLFDLQNSSVIMGGNTPIVITVPVISTPKKNDAFADMLSTVVKDSSIRVDDSVEIKNQIINASLKEDKKEVSSNTSAIQPALYSDVKKTMENISNDGLERIYTDNYGNATDTIRIFMPGNTKKTKTKKITIEDVVNENIPVPSVTSTPVTPAPVVPVPVQPAKKPVENNTTPAPKFIDDEVKKPATEEKKGEIENKVTEKSGTLAMINSDCHSIANEDDFFNLRKKMAAEKADDDMIRIAKKALKSKCYNTAYIKNLSVLFLTDQGRYNFFDAAYPFVADTQNFPVLEKELSDNYYITRFKAMIHK